VAQANLLPLLEKYDKEIFSSVPVIITKDDDGLPETEGYSNYFFIEQSTEAEKNIPLQNLTQKLISIDKMKDEFLSNTSHELQTPFNGIINITETLAEGNHGIINQRQRDELQVILALSKILSSLVKDIIDVERIKRNEIQFNFQIIDIKSLCDMVSRERNYYYICS